MTSKLYPKSLRALSVRQPFAAMIVIGDKSEEYRSWRTHKRGTILIHASAKAEGNWREYFAAFGYSPTELYLGAIVGAARLVDCAEILSGGYAWRLEGAIIFPQKPQCKGGLSFWKPLDENQDKAFHQAWQQLPADLRKSIN